MRTRNVLIGLLLFQGITACGGGIGLLGGRIAPDEALLAGSPFASYVVPGLALLGVGIGTLIASVAVLGRAGWSAPLAGVAGLAMIVYELVEFTTIDFHFLQAAYGLEGLAVVVLAVRVGWRGGPVRR
jgi:hypothetical protein